MLKVSVLADAHDEIARVARQAMASTLKTMAAVEFMSGVLQMLQSADPQVGLKDILESDN